MLTVSNSGDEINLKRIEVVNEVRMCANKIGLPTLFQSAGRRSLKPSFSSM